MKSEQPTATFKTFRELTFLHSGALYADALCLTSCQEEAAALVVETYVRAYLAYKQCPRSRSTKPGNTLAWLYGHLHAAFCDEILANKAGRNAFLLG